MVVHYYCTCICICLSSLIRYIITMIFMSQHTVLHSSRTVFTASHVMCIKSPNSILELDLRSSDNYPVYKAVVYRLLQHWWSSYTHIRLLSPVVLSNTVFYQTILTVVNQNLMCVFGTVSEFYIFNSVFYDDFKL